MCGHRHVVLPPEIAQHLPKNRLLSEVREVEQLLLFRCCCAVGPLQRLQLNTLLGCTVQNEWRGLGVQQSRGWEHYAIHRPEPHIMLFRYGGRRADLVQLLHGALPGSCEGFKPMWTCERAISSRRKSPAGPAHPPPHARGGCTISTSCRSSGCMCHAVCCRRPKGYGQPAHVVNAVGQPQMVG